MNAIDELINLKNEEQAGHLMRFFKTGKGQYGEGDLFLGIKVPKTREIVKKHYRNVSFAELQTMLNNPYHEIRLCALLMMVSIYEKSDNKNLKNQILKLYLRNVNNINNWDLVDLTAPKIVGADYIESKNPEIIMTLANSGHLWSERIAVVSQWSVIKSGDFSIILELSEKFLTHKHDLMHKAVGWMLREAGKKDEKILHEFLKKHHRKMPRTMLRYSIEKLTKEQRHFYMYPDKKNPSKDF